MSYKTYTVRDTISHRSYPVRKCDIDHTVAWSNREVALVLKYPVRKGDCEFNRNSVIVTNRTLDRMGIVKRPRA